MAQFLIIPSTEVKTPKFHNIKVRDTKNYSHEELVADIINIDWGEVLESEKADPNHSFQRFNEKVNEILDKHMPWKKLNKKELRLQAKPWITAGILTSIRRRDKLLHKWITAKDPVRKDLLRTEYKTLRNRITYIINLSKKTHYQQFFAENCANIRKTWTGIKNIINIRNANKNQPSSMLINKSIKTNPKDIAEGFNVYFSTIAEKFLPKDTPGTKHFSEYLTERVERNFIFESADPVEVISIINSLDPGKGSGPYSIPNNILKALKANLCYPLSTIIVICHLQLEFTQTS